MKIAMFSSKSYDEESFNEVSKELLVKSNNDEATSGKKTNLKIKYFEARLTADTVSLTKGYDAVCVFVNDEVNEEVVNKLYENGVRVLLLRCAGFNNVDLSACYGKIHVYRVPAYSPYSVAEHAMALLLTSVRRIHKAYIRTRDFNFSLQGMTGFDLHGKTVGIIGTGKIGRIFADICKGFGMNIICYDKFPNPDSGLNYVTLEELLRESDIISLHCPLTEETKHTICDETIEQMKKGVVIINTSRGALINTEDLIEGIKNKKIGAACLDVYEEEGDLFYQDFSGHIVQDDQLARLISMPNVIVTSHQAFLTKEALHNIAETTLNNALSFASDQPCHDNEVCYQCGNSDKCKKDRKEKCF